MHLIVHRKLAAGDVVPGQIVLVDGTFPIYVDETRRTSTGTVTLLGWPGTTAAEAGTRRASVSYEHANAVDIAPSAVESVQIIAEITNCAFTPINGAAARAIAKVDGLEWAIVIATNPLPEP